MAEGKKEARRMWKSGRATHECDEIVPRDTLRGRIEEMEKTEEGRKEMFGWMVLVGFAALFAYMALDMTVCG